MPSSFGARKARESRRGLFPLLSEADALAWIQRRLVTLMILEAARCLHEGLAQNADDLDCAMCLTGWATHRGGPIGYARQLGQEALTAHCDELPRPEHGPRFTAPVAGLGDFLNQYSFCGSVFSKTDDDVPAKLFIMSVLSSCTMSKGSGWTFVRFQSRSFFPRVCE